MADPPAPHAGAMAYVGPAPDDHELTASADALTKVRFAILHTLEYLNSIDPFLTLTR